MGITPAVPLREPESKKIQGVMAIDLTLKDISKFLNSLKISDSGRIFIIEKTGEMVATSTNNSLISQNSSGNGRLHYSNSKDPLIQATAAFLSEKFLSNSADFDEQLIFNFENNRHFIQLTQLNSSPGLDWLIITVIPESDFMEHIRSNTYTTLLLSVLALISALFLGAIANQLIINSITSVAQIAKGISQGKIAAFEEQPKIKELAIMSESINYMALRLQTSAENMEDLELKWEERVAETKNLQQVNQKLNRLANIDGLTQIYNRYHFNLALEQLWQDTLQERETIVLIMCDVDNFKQYNDTYGHLMGDQCLKQVAQTIAQTVNRNKDIAARYGGEEFAIILPRTDSEGGIKVAHNINQAIRNLNIVHATSTVANHVTISCGVGCMIPNLNLSVTSLIEQADKALYKAKQRGKNCYVLG